MKTKILFGMALLLMAQAANAEGDAGLQLSAYAGQQRLRIDHDHLVTDETVRMDTAWTGLAIGYRFEQGMLVEGAYAYSLHDDWSFFTEEGDLDMHHYSLAPVSCAQR
jgi:hypothetical protein